MNALGRRISSVSGKDREAAFLFQRIYVSIQRFNSELLHRSFADDDPVVTQSLLFLTNNNNNNNKIR